MYIYVYISVKLYCISDIYGICVVVVVVVVVVALV